LAQQTVKLCSDVVAQSKRTNKTSTGKRVAFEQSNIQLEAENKRLRREGRVGKAPKKMKERQVLKDRVYFEKKGKQELIRVYNLEVGKAGSLEALYRKFANECLGASKENHNPRNDKDKVVCFFKERRRRDKRESRPTRPLSSCPCPSNTRQ